MDSNQKPDSTESEQKPEVPTAGDTFNAEPEVSPAVSSDVPNTDTPPLTETEPARAKTPTPGVVTSPQKGGKGKKLFVWVVILVLLGAAGYAAYTYYNNHKAKKTSAAVVVVKKDVPLIRYGVFESFLNEFLPNVKSGEVAMFMNRQVFDGLVSYENQSKIVPGLATSWTNPDDKTWIFNLKQGVKFHNGHTMTAKDVVHGYELMKTNDYVSYTTDTIASMEAVNDYQVKITTNGVDPVLLNRLANMPVIDSASKSGDPAGGTGPYMVKAGTTPTEDKIDLVAFDDYHGGHVYTREIQFNKYINEETEGKDAKGISGGEKQALADLKAHKLDIAGIFTGQNVKAAQAETQFKEISVPSLIVYYISLNTLNKGPLQNLKVRQAIALALNYGNITKDVGKLHAQQASQIVPNQVPGYNPAIKNVTQDIAKAKQLMTEAGYPKGTNITFTTDSYSNNDALTKDIADSLKTIGITTKVANVGEDEYFSGVDNGTHESWYMGYSTDLIDASDVFSFMTPSKFYNNDEVNKLIDEANQTLDGAKRLALLQKASKVLMDDQMLIPLYTAPYVYYSNENYSMQLDYFGLDLGVSFAKVHQ